jgi:membrane-bound serine protease (ClpP class)
MTPLGWAVVLLVVGLLLVLAELFVPSGGVLGFISTAALIAAVVEAYRHSPYAGLAFLAGTAIGTPILIALGLQIWPRTPLGRRILLEAPHGEDVLPDDDLRRRLKDLLGKVGIAKTLMLPGGPIEVGGRTYDAVSEGQPVQPGTAVKIIEVRGTRVVVRPTAELPPQVRKADDPLNRSIDEVGLDPFDDPLK